jgi:osmotically-inducible protein OsmY
MIDHKNSALLLLLLTVATMQGCVPVAIMGTTAAVGTSMAEERGLKGVVSDTQIRAGINMKWMDYDSRINDNVELTVREGRVLLAGHVPNPQMQIDAVRLAWQVEGVKEVIDETVVGEDGGFSEFASDSWIITQIRSKLLFDQNINSLNYTIKTVKGVVYVMGIAQNQKELNAVLHYARHVGGVKKVVSYVRLKGEASAPPVPAEENISADEGPGFEPAPAQGGVAVRPLAPPSPAGEEY